jgi:hypothetical protein
MVAGQYFGRKKRVKEDTKFNHLYKDYLAMSIKYVKRSNLQISTCITFLS